MDKYTKGFFWVGRDACFEEVELIGALQGALRAISTICLWNNCFFNIGVK